MVYVHQLNRWRSASKCDLAAPIWVALAFHLQQCNGDVGICSFSSELTWFLRSPIFKHAEFFLPLRKAVYVICLWPFLPLYHSSSTSLTSSLPFFSSHSCCQSEVLTVVPLSTGQAISRNKRHCWNFGVFTSISPTFSCVSHCDTPLKSHTISVKNFHVLAVK